MQNVPNSRFDPTPSPSPNSGRGANGRLARDAHGEFDKSMCMINVESL